MPSDLIPTLTDVRHWLLFVGWLAVAGGALLTVYAIVGQLGLWAHAWRRSRRARAVAEERRLIALADEAEIARVQRRRHLDTLVVFPGRRTH